MAFYICSVNDASPAPETAEPPDPAPDLGQDWTQRHLRMLERAGEMMMELAEVLQRRALEQAAADVVGEGAAAADKALAVTVGGIERVHRSLRRIIALETHIAEGVLARRLKAQIERAERAQARGLRIGERKRAVHDAVTLVAMEDRSERETERLFDAISDWIDTAADETFADERAVGEIVAGACRDLGLPIDLSLWTHEAWAIEEMLTRPPGSPYAAFRLIPRGPHAPIWPERDIPGLPPLADTG